MEISEAELARYKAIEATTIALISRSPVRGTDVAAVAMALKPVYEPLVSSQEHQQIMGLVGSVGHIQLRKVGALYLRKAADRLEWEGGTYLTKLREWADAEEKP